MIAYNFLLDIGSRDEQQDSCDIFKKDEKVLLALADGMGGHKGGFMASNIFLKEAKKGFDLSKKPHDMFKDIANSTKNYFLREKDKNPTINPHTTCALALIDDIRLYFSHIGDSRIYLFKDKNLIYQSKDHSVVQMLVGMGELKEEEMATHPDQNRLLGSIGANENTQIFYHEVFLSKNDNFTILLCSDGFWGNIKKERIIYHLFSNPLEIALKNMLDEIKKNGNKNLDNISVCAYKKDNNSILVKVKK